MLGTSTTLINSTFGTFDRVVEECGVVLGHNFGGYINYSLKVWSLCNSKLE